MNKVGLIRQSRGNFHSLVNLDIIDHSEFMSHTGYFALSHFNLGNVRGAHFGQYGTVSKMAIRSVCDEY
jgi:hypothetical protein